MHPSPRAHSVGKVIHLNAKMLEHCDRQQIETMIGRIVRNVHFEFLERECAIRLLGPDIYYHALDPHLPATLKQFDPPIAMDEVLSYRLQGDLFDLCFEDSWSGYLIADHLRRSRPNDNLVIIHLDDHTDMMSTLLECSHEGVLVDPTTGKPFDPKRPSDWKIGIHSGSVSIGCFITPFYFTDLRTHVRHLKSNVAAHSCDVIREPYSYNLIPEKRFAAIRLSDIDDAANTGSYAVSSHCGEILDDLPPGQVIVHVDLDYFINDFNGNPREGAYTPAPALMEEGRRKLDHFFEAMCSRRVNVDRWIIATSPGFCSACHWARLLNAFTEKILGYHNGP